jgi:peptidoglycan/xylan/chitin deacetylase (PgdA/CDA1 family)
LSGTNGPPSLLAGVLLLLLALMAADRTIEIDGKLLAIPVRAEADGVHLPVNLLVSGEQRTLLATLIDRGWTPDDPVGEKAHPETPVRLAGRTPDFDLEHAGARIDERLRLLLWRRPERLRGLPLWIGLALKQPGVKPLSPPAKPPTLAQDAMDRVLADVSFGLSQVRHVATQPRVLWIELAEPPKGAENLLIDLPQSAEPAPPAPPPSSTPPVLKQLPPVQPVAAEVISRPDDKVARVALTFDACATLDRSFYDDRITRVLVATKTPATLFISGRWAETHLRQMRALAQIPLFEIANHSYIHPHMTEVPPERQREELVWTQQILLTLTGKLPRFFRAPYGDVDAELAGVAAPTGLRTVEYDFPSGDPDKHITKERLIAWVLAKARPGSIVVMHMNRRGWHTAEALPEIVAGLRAKGFVLSQVGEMVDEAARR